MSKNLTPTADDVYAVLGSVPFSAATLGYDIVERLTGVRPKQDKYETNSQVLSRAGLPVSRIQRVLDQLVADGRAYCVPQRGYQARGNGYVSDVAYREQLAKADAEVRERRQAGLRAKAQRIVLERHAAEVEAVLAELLAEVSS